MTFLTPAGALVALAALPPLAAWLAGRRRAGAVRRILGLAPPARARGLRVLALAGSFAFLGLATAQPALTRESRQRERRGVEALFVLDTSRSMAASATRTGATRLDRAVAAAVRLRADIADVPSGVATLTDRVLPDLLPVPDAASFDAVAERAVAIETPPPRETSVRATSYSVLDEVASGNYFDPHSATRIVVLLTDGESGPVDPGRVARALSPARGYRFLAVRFWHRGEAVFDANGKQETAYQPDPLGRVVLAGLAAAAGGKAFDESRPAAAASYLRQAAGSGPTTLSAGVTVSRRTLAPYIAALAVLLLALFLVPSRVVESISR